MIFGDLKEKYGLLKAALSVENSINEINERVLGLKREEEKLNREYSDKDEKNYLIESKINQLKDINLPRIIRKH